MESKCDPEEKSSYPPTVTSSDRLQVVPLCCWRKQLEIFSYFFPPKSGRACAEPFLAKPTFKGDMVKIGSSLLGEKITSSRTTFSGGEWPEAENNTKEITACTVVSRFLRCQGMFLERLEQDLHRLSSLSTLQSFFRSPEIGGPVFGQEMN